MPGKSERTRTIWKQLDCSSEECKIQKSKKIFPEKASPRSKKG